ncbi:hypothetical protein ANCDUO_09685 [Ancylostoma duodenale]|uniref:Uncharacterized protein n=1 Tax=Ancylostoma duodenale TaxID=51022 RepID=A0A0C2DCA5_9BILA|nr:hypothetical protein ANCDUO_09685 [Ancylostoma duodenale]
MPNTCIHRQILLEEVAFMGELQVFGDVRVHVGGKAVFDCVLLGSPRPKAVSTESFTSEGSPAATGSKL